MKLELLVVLVLLALLVASVFIIISDGKPKIYCNPSINSTCGDILNSYVLECRDSIITVDYTSTVISLDVTKRLNDCFLMYDVIHSDSPDYSEKYMICEIPHAKLKPNVFNIIDYCEGPLKDNIDNNIPGLGGASNL